MSRRTPSGPALAVRCRTRSGRRPASSPWRRGRRPLRGRVRRTSIRGARVPYGLRPAVALGATAVMAGLLGWFGAELISGGRQVGLAERVLAGTQAVWPLVVVLTCLGVAAGGWPQAGTTLPFGKIFKSFIPNERRCLPRDDRGVADLSSGHALPPACRSHGPPRHRVCLRSSRPGPGHRGRRRPGHPPGDRRAGLPDRPAYRRGRGRGPARRRHPLRARARHPAAAPGGGGLPGAGRPDAR